MLDENAFCYKLNDRVTGIPQGSVVNLLFGLILMATFLYSLYRVNANNKAALAGVNNARALCFSIHVTFLQATSVWAVLWAMYKVFSTEDGTPGREYFHATAHGLVQGASVVMEVAVCVFLLIGDAGQIAINASAIVSILCGVATTAVVIVVEALYPGDSLDLTDTTILAFIILQSFYATGYVAMAIVSCMNRKKHQYRAMFAYTPFLAIRYVGQIIALILKYYSQDSGLCVEAGVNLIYFSLYAYVLYETLLIDSEYWRRFLGARFAGGQMNLKGVNFASRLQSITTTSTSTMDTDGISRSVSHSFLDPQSPLVSNDAVQADPLCQDNLIPCNQLCFVRHLTHGGGGIVDLYMWQGKQVVVKKLQLRMCSTDYFDQFSKEAGILRRLRHDNIVGFIGIYFDPPHLGIVMEYCAHGSLYDVLTSGSFDFNRSSPLRMAREIASGMAYLHTRATAVLHRDLKSMNVLIDDMYRAKLADFGDSRLITKGYTGMLSLKGTPRWMSPEALRNQNEPITLASDVYSFGVVLWELLTWKPPFLVPTPRGATSAAGYEGPQPTIAQIKAMVPPRPSPRTTTRSQSGNAAAGNKARSSSVSGNGGSPANAGIGIAIGGSSPSRGPKSSPLSEPLLEPLHAHQEGKDEKGVVRDGSHGNIEDVGMLEINDVHQARTYVADMHLRPPLPIGIPAALGELLDMCWRDRPSERPSFTEIVSRLGSIPDLDKELYPFPVVVPSDPRRPPRTLSKLAAELARA